jgi:hypothetical protein
MIRLYRKHWAYYRDGSGAGKPIYVWATDNKTAQDKATAKGFQSGERLQKELGL